jgi:spore coat protein U-like protein
MIRWWRAWLTALALAMALPAEALVSCTVSTTDVAFGIYNPLNATPATSNGSITVTCTLLSGGNGNVQVHVHLGTGSSGNYATRTMLSGVNVLNYNLYRSPVYTQVWGNGTGGSLDESGGLDLTPGNPTDSISGTIYGLVPAGQDPGPGDFSDTIIATITY